MPVGSQHFHPAGSGRVHLRLHCLGVVVRDRVLWTREWRVYADMPTRFDIMYDLALTLHGYSHSHSRTGQEDPYCRP